MSTFHISIESLSVKVDIYEISTPEDEYAQPFKITRYIKLLSTQHNIPGANTGSAQPVTDT
jgi:hypothetical protein